MPRSPRPGSRLSHLTTVLCAVLTATAAAAQPPPVATQATFDLILRGGRIVDGAGTDPRAADIGVRAGRIAEVGQIPADAAATRTLDVTGLVVAPGFIDVHAHADEDAADKPEAESFLRMGVTTIITGNCGSSVPVLGAHFARLEAQGISINYGTLIGHGTIRTGVMRTAPRAPTEGELGRMRTRVAAAMHEGAFGMSTGLIYVPGTYAETEELIELSKVVAEHGGVYASHMRHEDDQVLTSIAEAIRIGREAGCRIHLSHLKASGKAVWGYGDRIVEALAKARADGVAVTGDQYLYTASSTGLEILFPARELSVGREAFGTRLAEDAAFAAAMADAVLAQAAHAGFVDLAYAQIANAPNHPEWNGKRLNEVARLLFGRDDARAQAEAACRLMTDAKGPRVSMVYHKMSEGDVERILRAPFVAIASDAGIRSRDGNDRPHPRGSGNNARLLGHYVRDREVVSLALAVQKMTSLPATVFGLEDRGRIAPGMHADLVVFDPARVRDTATYDEPRGDPEGIPHVLVNGVLVIEAHVHTRARPGMVLRHQKAKTSANPKKTP